MTLQEAIESGKPFRRESNKADEISCRWFHEGKSQFKLFSDEEICATDWIVKYDCETCKDTKRVSNYGTPCPDCSTPKYKCNTCKDTKEVEQWLEGDRLMNIRCPDCSVPSITAAVDRILADPNLFHDNKCSEPPKLQLEVGKKYLNIHGVTCEIRTIKLDGVKAIFIDSHGYTYYENGLPCRAPFNLISEVKDEPPKMKKITVYRPVFEVNTDQYELGDTLYKNKEDTKLNEFGVDIAGGIFVGWKPEEIVVMEKGESK